MINKPEEFARLALLAQEYENGLTQTQAARLLHVRPESVKEAVKRGDLKEICCLCRRRRRISRASVAAYIQRVSVDNG